VVELEAPTHAASEGSASSSPPFETFVAASSDRLFRALYLITGNRQEAEDVMQDAFLAVWERWDRVGGLDDPTAYLFRTAMNHWRKRVRRGKVVLKRAISFVPPQDPFADVDDRDIVFRALKDLHPNQRAALVVTALLGYPSEEAGSILHMSAATVRMHASRGRAAMQGLIGDAHDR
jgi:RNA polymerase sigma factor (sigma-70 family)